MSDGSEICDNDCGTVICETCENEFYIIVILGLRFLMRGHSPHCGNE
jgi:hypothetical protein